MTGRGPQRSGPVPADRQVVVTGMAVLSAFGRGTAPLLAGVLAGRPAFTPVTRFDTATRRVRVAATAAGVPELTDELVRALDEAGTQAHLDPSARAGIPLLLAVHGDPRMARVPGT
ncbi:MAG: hypothetical protein WCA46_02140, partial [Actinocatenispora sp.]